jgi:hypothetical protein
MHISNGSLGFLGRLIVLIGLSAALAACGDEASSSGSAGSGSTGSTSNTGSTSPTAQLESITLSWAAPTENTDGSALTNLAGFDIYYGTSAASLTQKISINSVGLLTYVVENLSSGTWFFEVVAVNSAGVQSGPSSLVSVSI